MTIPFWALTIAYWLHMLATVIWIGALASLALVILPAARRTLNAQSYGDLLGQIQKRFDPLAWFSVVLLAATGMIQMSANPNYAGFLAIGNRWATAILIKHLVFVVMVGVSAYMTWGLLPQLRRLAMRRARQASIEDDVESRRLASREAWLLRLNLVLGVLVLGLTAIARSA